MSSDLPTKPVVSITEMAKMCGLSYQRFAQLRREGYFPAPLRDAESNRQFYDEELQRTCLLVRQRNMGINGKQIMFYSARSSTLSTAPRPRNRKVKQAKESRQHGSLIEAVKSLGLMDASPDGVEKALKSLYPNGWSDVAETEVVRSVFVFLMRKNCDS